MLGDPLFLKERTGRQVWGTWTPDQWFSKIKEQVKEPTLNCWLFASSFRKSTRKNWWASSKKTSARIYFGPPSLQTSVFDNQKIALHALRQFNNELHTFQNSQCSLFTHSFAHKVIHEKAKLTHGQESCGTK